MREQVVLNIKGYPVKVMINYTSKPSRSYHYCFGMINAKVKSNTSLKQIEKNLNNVFSEEIVKNFNQAPFIDGNYAYILGEIERVYPQDNSGLLDKLYVFYKGKKILAKKFLLIVITERVRYYEKIMNLPEHQVKIKQLSAVLGNNHYKTKILSFNEMLIYFAPELIDQVIIHELCHDFYQDHSKNFYDKFREFCPDYKLKKEKLINGVRK